MELAWVWQGPLPPAGSTATASASVSAFIPLDIQGGGKEQLCNTQNTWGSPRVFRDLSPVDVEHSRLRRADDGRHQGRGP